MTELLCGLDIGTSSSKGVLVTLDGTIVARAQRNHELSLPRPGWAEHDAEAIWWSEAESILRELKASDRGTIAALGVSGIGPCMVPADVNGRPLRPAVLYGIDTRAELEIDEINARLGLGRILERGGSALTSQALGPKLLWLRHAEPDVWARTRRFYMASSYIVGRLTGAYVLDHHSASQCDPLYDIGTSGWARDWAEEIVPGLDLPELLWSSDIAGNVTPAAAAATGLPAGIPVVAGTIDAWAEALSAGVREPGDTMLMYGTTLFIIEVVNRFVPDRTLWATEGVDRGSRTLAAGMSTSGALTGWLRQVCGNPPYEDLVDEAAAVEAGSGGLVTLPYFAGERTPLYDPSARGLILGLTLSHGRGHLYRSLLEATAFGVRHILETLDAAGQTPSRLVAVGGGTKGGLWTQIVSNVTGRPQEVAAETIGASYGDALLAGLGTGLLNPGTNWARVAQVVVPDPATRPVYDDLYAIYRSLYPATRDQAHALATLQVRAARLTPR